MMNTVRTLLAIALLGCAVQAGAAAPAREGFDEQIDALARDGYEHPARALAALAELRSEHERSPNERRMLLQAMGSIEARAGCSKPSRVRASICSSKPSRAGAAAPACTAQPSTAIARRVRAVFIMPPPPAVSGLARA